MATDMKTVFLGNGRAEFEEAIIYTPYQGSPITIKGIIVRERLTTKDSPDQNRLLSKQAEIHIANLVTYGVTSVKKGFDTLQFPYRVGDASNATYKVVDILGNDAGAWHLLVEQ